MASNRRKNLRVRAVEAVEARPFFTRAQNIGNPPIAQVDTHPQREKPDADPHAHAPHVAKATNDRQQQHAYYDVRIKLVVVDWKTPLPVPGAPRNPSVEFVVTKYLSQELDKELSMAAAAVTPTLGVGVTELSFQPRQRLRPTI